LQQLDIGAILDKDISIAWLVVAGNAEAVDPFAYLAGATGIGVGIGLRELAAARVDEMTIDEPVLRRHLRRGPAGDLKADAARLEHNHRFARLHQPQRRGEADDAAADDEHVGMQGLLEAGKVRRRRARSPTAGAAAAKLPRTRTISRFCA
jgi:hypothetical protein